MLYPNHPAKCPHCIDDKEETYYLCSKDNTKSKCTLRFVGLATYCPKIHQELLAQK